MCIKTETGNCQGCDLFNSGIKFIKTDGIPYQNVEDVWWNNYCPPDQKPTIEAKYGKTGLETLAIEGEIIKQK